MLSFYSLKMCIVPPKAFTSVATSSSEITVYSDGSVTPDQSPFDASPLGAPSLIEREEPHHASSDGKV